MRRRARRLTAPVLALILLAACVHPGLTGRAKVLATADQVVVALDAFQQVCIAAEAAGALSTDTTRTVVIAVMTTVKILAVTPDGAQATAIAVIDALTMQSLDQRLLPYLTAARAAIQGVS